MNVFFKWIMRIIFKLKRGAQLLHDWLRRKIVSHYRKTEIVVVFSICGILLSVVYIIWSTGFYNDDVEDFDDYVPEFNYDISLEDIVTDYEPYDSIVEQMKADFSSYSCHQRFDIGTHSITYYFLLSKNDYHEHSIHQKVALSFQLPEGATLSDTELLNIPFIDTSNYQSLLKTHSKCDSLILDTFDEADYDKAKIDSLYKSIYLIQQFKHTETAFGNHEMSFVADKPQMALSFTVDFNTSIGYLNTRHLNIFGFCNADSLPVNFSSDIQFSSKVQIERLAPSTNFQPSFYSSKSMSLTNLSEFEIGNYHSNLLISFSSLRHRVIHDLLMIILPMLIGTCVAALIQVYLNPKQVITK